jgi:hypothetical protein
MLHLEEVIRVEIPALIEENDTYSISINTIVDFSHTYRKRW